MRVLTLLFLLVAFTAAIDHQCIHDKLPHDEVVTIGGDIAPGRRQAVESIRVTPFFQTQDACATEGATVSLHSGATHTCTSADVLTEQKSAALKKHVQSAVEFFFKVFKVDPLGPTEQSTLIGRKCPSYMAHELTSADQEAVSESDMAIIVTALPIDQSGVLAFASSCVQLANGRPVLGYINVAPKELLLENTEERYIRGIIIHEIMHALGFSSSRLPLDAENVLSKTFTNTYETVSEHFGCKNDAELQVLIEDGGGSGTAGSHLEKKVFLNEVMTGSLGKVPVISKISLSVFADFGFYEVNMDYAESYSTGYEEGCSALSISCDAQNFPYWCEVSNVEKCSFDRTGIGYCVDTDSLTNCAYVSPHSTGQCTGSSTRVQSKLYGETYGVPNSRCFEGTAVSITSAHACFEVFCLANSYMVSIGSDWFECDDSTQKISNPAFVGTFNCPRHEELCLDKIEEDAAEFPRILSITPASGTVGDTVTFVGENLEGAKLGIVEACESTTKVDDTHFTCVIPELKSIVNALSSAAASSVSAFAQHPTKSYRHVKPDAFELKIGAQEIWTTFSNWSKRNLFLTVVIIFGAVMLVGLIVFGVFRCIKKK